MSVIAHAPALADETEVCQRALAGAEGPIPSTPPTPPPGSDQRRGRPCDPVTSAETDDTNLPNLPEGVTDAVKHPRLDQRRRAAEWVLASASEGSPMPDLPMGTVTFLFSDIEGSAHLLQHLGNRYADVRADYRRLLRAAFQAAGGHEIDTAGDGFFAVFHRATDAVAAAVASQCTIVARPWPE